MGRSSRSSASSRTSTLRKPVPKARPAAAPSKAPAPVQNSNVPAHQPQERQSFLGAMASTVASGFAFGTGSAVAHRAVDSVLGPRGGSHPNETEPVEVQQQVPSSMARGSELCAADLKAFNDCLVKSNNNIGECQFYFDILQQCKNNA